MTPTNTDLMSIMSAMVVERIVRSAVRNVERSDEKNVRSAVKAVGKPTVR
jgi:hypothetical protein